MIAEGYLLFDDTIIDKKYTHKMSWYVVSGCGNAHSVIKGIGAETCVYDNSKTEQHCVVDYRIFDLEGNGKSKLDYLPEMLEYSRTYKKLLLRNVLMDSWYATRVMG